MTSLGFEEPAGGRLVSLPLPLSVEDVGSGLTAGEDGRDGGTARGICEGGGADVDGALGMGVGCGGGGVGGEVGAGCKEGV